jgi:hypothetical protein
MPMCLHLQAAADSPFLENAIGAAGAVLIILTLPSSALLLEGGQRPTEALNDPEKYALRAAVQVGRGVWWLGTGWHGSSSSSLNSLCSTLYVIQTQLQFEQRLVAAALMLVLQYRLLAPNVSRSPCDDLEMALRWLCNMLPCSSI